MRLGNKEIRKSHLSQFLLYSSKLRMDVINQPLTCCSLPLEASNLASNLISVKKNPISKIRSLRYMWWSHILFAVVTQWSIFLTGWLDSKIVMLEGQKRLVSTVCFKALGFWVFLPLRKGYQFWKAWPVTCRRQWCGRKESVHWIPEIQLWPMAGAQVTFTSICAAQGTLVPASWGHSVCAESWHYRALQDSVHHFFPSQNG